jgi:O-antigen/teichoic acid export membrane protein
MSNGTEPRAEAGVFGGPAAPGRMAIRMLAYLPGMRRLTSSGPMLAALRGSAWTIAAYAASQSLRLATTLFLARQLLSPEAFGLVALVNVYLTGLDMLSDLGIGMDVVQHPRGDDPVFINTAFLIQVGRGATIWLVATAFAYPFGYLYNQPGVCPLAVVGAVSIAVRGVASGSVWLMTRHIQLRKLAALNVGSETAGFLISILWASIAPTAWALIGGRLAAGIVYTVGSHLLADHRVSLRWDRTAARDIFVFGAGIFVSTATYFLCGEAERLVIGKFISIEELGCFSLALALAAAPARALQQVVGQVLFPIMASSMRKDREAAARHFRAARFVFLVLGIALAVGFVGFSRGFVTTWLPANYAMTAWMLQVMGFRAGLEVFTTPAWILILACGDSRYSAIANITRLVLMFTGVWFAFSEFGIHEAVMVLAIVPLIVYPIVFVGIARHLPGLLWFEITSLGIFSGVTGIATALAWLWRAGA